MNDTSRKGLAVQIGTFETPEEASATAARGIVDLLTHKSNAALGVATGSTPGDLYSELREAHAAGRFTLEGSAALAPDEYVGIADGHPEKYRNVLRRKLVGPEKTGLTEAGLRTPVSSDADPRLATGQHEALIAATGGVDLQILGIGANRHIGFNEPGGSLVSHTRVEVLSHRARTGNARFFNSDVGRVPSRYITQGLEMIMGARSLLLLAFGAQKTEAVHQLVEGTISAEWPATVAQVYLDLTVFVDAETTELLEHADLYRRRWGLA